MNDTIRGRAGTKATRVTPRGPVAASEANASPERAAALRLRAVALEACAELSHDAACIIRFFAADTARPNEAAAAARGLRDAALALIHAGPENGGRGAALDALWDAADDFIDGAQWAETNPAASAASFGLVGSAAHRARAIAAREAAKGRG